MRILAAIAVLSLAGSLAFDWADRPIGTSSSPCNKGNNCAQCHQGSPPRTHTAEFIESSHGAVASFHRQQCIGCHEQNSCDACHLKTPPAWHTKAFQNPACGRAQRDEHALIATNHRSTCGECHNQRFQHQCAECHRPDEEYLRLKSHN